MHRESFRSDVLVSFNPPIKLSTRQHIDLFDPVSSNRSDKLDGVKQLTGLLYEQIRQGTIDAPNFGVTRVANTARRIYAPFGTGMTLGDHVHVTSRFVDVFSSRHRPSASLAPSEALMTPIPVATVSAASSKDITAPCHDVGNASLEHTAPLETEYFDGASRRRIENGPGITDQEVEELASDLHVRSSVRFIHLYELIRLIKAYQDILKHLGLKDDRVRRPPLKRAVLLKRLAVRLAGSALLLGIATPGLALWLPVFSTAAFFGWRCRTGGRIEDGRFAYELVVYAD